MLAPRWRKVLRELWGNKTRSLLVVLSIAVGVFAVGMIAIARTVLARELTAAYLASNPSSAILYTGPLSEGAVQAVRGMKEVGEAEGRRMVMVRLQAAPGLWRNLQLVAIPDYDDIRLDRVEPEEGAWPPPKHEMLVERASLGWLNAQVGDVALIEAPSGKQYRVRIAGTTHDSTRASPLFGGAAFGHITDGTLDWLGGATSTQLGITAAERPLDREHVRDVANRVRDKIEKGGGSILYISIPTRLNEHPMNDFIQPMILVLGILGLLSLLLSGFLVANTLSAVLVQQVRQIGVMKAVGAREGQIVGLYLGTVLAYGLLALLMGLPLGVIGAREFSRFLASFVNADITSFSVPWQAVALQLGVGLVVPLLAALAPVLTGTRITVRQAVAGHGLGQARSRTGVIGRPLVHVPGVPRPLLLSLRNTLRRKGRLALTLATLTLAGAMFVAVFSVRASLFAAIEDTLAFTRHDVHINLSRPYRCAGIEQALLHVPGIARPESRITANVRRLRPDGSESGNLFLTALPAESEMIRPTVIRGRWLLPGDENALVVSTDLARDDPDVDVGSDIVLKIDGRETTWHVVGVIQAVLMNVPPIPNLFASLPYYARVARGVGRANQVMLETVSHDPKAQARAAREAEARLKEVGISLNARETASETRARIQAIFGVLVAFFLVMAILLAVVGGLGLMGTMSLNVLERTCEIGVMRAIGASDGAVRQIVVVEGVAIGVLSWLLGAILAVPLGGLMADVVGRALLKMPLRYSFSLGGTGLWLGVVIAIAALASWLPARRASRLTVREVLAYE